MRENTDQKNSEYRHFSCSVIDVLVFQKRGLLLVVMQDGVNNQGNKPTILRNAKSPGNTVFNTTNMYQFVRDLINKTKHILISKSKRLISNTIWMKKTCMCLDAQARADASQEISFHGFDLHKNYDLASKLELSLVDKEIWYLIKNSLITLDFKENRFYLF